ncbi:MAG: hypothetical protein COA67_10555 [Lutibacter sp.]|nr:MAG: hypothetical protein COA67_10555 [Lutibacter sp.]
MKDIFCIIAVLFGVSLLAQDNDEKIYNFNVVKEIPIIVGCEESADREKCFKEVLFEKLSDYIFDCNCTSRQRFYIIFVFKSNGMISDIEIRGNQNGLLKMYRNEEEREKEEKEEEERAIAKNKTREDFSSDSGFGDHKDSLFWKEAEEIGRPNSFNSRMKYFIKNNIKVSKPAQMNGENVSVRYMLPISLSF